MPKHFLQVHRADQMLSSTRLAGHPLLLGRASECDLMLEGDGVSRRHARLVRSSHGVYNLLDLRSTNGTGSALTISAAVSFSECGRPSR